MPCPARLALEHQPPSQLAGTWGPLLFSALHSATRKSQPALEMTALPPAPRCSTSPGFDQSSGSTALTLHAHASWDPFNTEAWNASIRKAEEAADLDTIKAAYEALLGHYPDTVRFFPVRVQSRSAPRRKPSLSHVRAKSAAQIAYLIHAMKDQASSQFAESLFTRFLHTSASVDLFELYIVYVRLGASPCLLEHSLTALSGD